MSTAGADHTIVYCCFGPRVYAEMLELSLASVRGAGGYRGNIVVVAPIEVVRRPGLIDRIQSGGGGAFLPMHAPSDVGVGRLKINSLAETGWLVQRKAGRVLFLDCDILAVTPLSPLLEDPFDGLRYCEEAQYKMTARQFGAMLTADERKWVETLEFRGINSGSFSIPAARLGALAHAWMALDRGSAGRHDQPSFNALVLRGCIPAEAFPSGTVEFPTQTGGPIDAQTRLLHFCGPGMPKAESLCRMREWGR